jgi:opacity protein-like surface antigen
MGEGQMSRLMSGFALTLVALIGLSSTTYADQGADTAPDDPRILGPYIGFGGSYGWATKLEDAIQDSIVLPPGVTSVDLDGSGGFDSHFGYRFLPYLGAEIQLEYLPGFELNAQQEAFLPSTELLKQQVLTTTVNAKVTPIRWGGFEPFGTFGIGFLWSQSKLPGVGDVDNSNTVFALRGGGGFDIYIYEPLALSVSATYVKPFQTYEDELDYVSVNFGLQYHFESFRLPGR